MEGTWKEMTRGWWRADSNSGMDGVEAKARAQTGSVLPSFSQQALPGHHHPQAASPKAKKGKAQKRGKGGWS